MLGPVAASASGETREVHYAARESSPAQGLYISESSFKLQAAVHAFRGVPQGRTALRWRMDAHAAS